MSFKTETLMSSPGCHLKEIITKFDSQHSIRGEEGGAAEPLHKYNGEGRLHLRLPRAGRDLSRHAEWETALRQTYAVEEAWSHSQSLLHLLDK